ncbi:MAG TPA: hypothetical protein VGV68_15045, partial [Terriglobia bacterium]|nr:hypothetical protein [Terriglobia bacterium]
MLPWVASGMDIIDASSLVTNADSGVTVALTYHLGDYWSNFTTDPYSLSGYVPEQDFHRLVAISGGSVVS